MINKRSFMMVTKRYNGRFFSVLGDSVSTLAGYNPQECGVHYDWQMKRMTNITDMVDTWWGKVITELGGQLLVNHSWSGSTACRLPGCEIECYGCSDHRTGILGTEDQAPDVVMIFLGINDLGFGVGLEDFSAAYELMLRKIHNNYPQAEIWCLTIPNFSGIGSRAEGHNGVIRACAAAEGCRCMDLYRPDVLCDTIDGIHPTARGMMTMAELVLELILGDA
jgi:lysophospholipase L1-like esterase